MDHKQLKTMSNSELLTTLESTMQEAMSRDIIILPMYFTKENINSVNQNMDLTDEEFRSFKDEKESWINKEISMYITELIKKYLIKEWLPDHRKSV